jgi:hypothetical protein
MTEIIALPSFSQTFSYETYNALVEPHDASVSVTPRETLIFERLGAIFVKFRVQNLFGVALLHRHHDLDIAASEVLVERFLDGTSVTEPKAFSDGLVPHTWKLFVASDGAVELQPLEFIAVGEETPDFHEQAQQLGQNLDFLREVFETLQELNVADVLGINLIHRDSLRTADKWYLKEKSSSKDKQSIVRPIGPDEKKGSVITSWRFTDDAACIQDCCCRGSWQCSDD